jgi:hypothetical protein
MSGLAPESELKNCLQFSRQVFPLLAAHFASVNSGG